MLARTRQTRICIFPLTATDKHRLAQMISSTASPFRYEEVRHVIGMNYFWQHNLIFFIYRAELAGKKEHSPISILDVIWGFLSVSEGLKIWMNNWWPENSWKWNENLWACLTLPLSLVVLSALNAAKHFQWVTIEMIIAVAVMKKIGLKPQGQYQHDRYAEQRKKHK